MKKLMTLMLSMSLIFGTVATVSAQEVPRKDDSKNKKSAKKGKKEPTKKSEKGGHPNGASL